jgi:hypothetical protein
MEVDRHKESIVVDYEDLEAGRECSNSEFGSVTVVTDPLDSPCVNAALIGYIFVCNMLFLALNIWHATTFMDYRSHNFII